MLQRHSRGEDEGSLGAAVQGFPGRGLVGELHYALPSGPAAVVHDHYGALDGAEHGEGLLQQLVGHELRQVLHRQRGAVSGEAHADLPAAEHRVVQLGFGDVRQGLRLLRIRQRRS